MTPAEFVAVLEQRQLDPKAAGAGKWASRCPAHDDRNPSLTIATGDDGRVLVHCHSGCEPSDVLAALNLDAADLFARNGDRRAQLVEVYVYTDEAGEPLLEVGRFADKRFLQRRPGVIDWKGGVAGVRRVLYRLPAVLEAAQDGRRVWVVEGERDVHALEQVGEVATCNPGGAGKWRDEYSAALEDADVTVVADRDKPGRDHALTAARSLRAHGCAVTIVEAAEGKDAADHLAAGRSLDDLVTVDIDVASEAPARRLRFRTPDELRQLAPATPSMILDGLIAKGSVVLWGGKPKSGKTTVVMATVDAIAAGAASFLGRTITPTTVVYVSEETAATLAHKLPASARVRILTRDDAWPKPDWPELVAEAVAEAQAHNADLIVIDTLPFWAGMVADSEKDAGAAQAVMAPILEAAANLGIAFVIVVHERKGGGADGEGIRGSSAFAGAVDIIVEVARMPNNPRQRALLVLSRCPGSPGTLVVELDPATGAWAVIGEAADRGEARQIADRQALLDALDGQPLTRAELEVALDAPALQWKKTLDELEHDGQVIHTGQGKKGNPYRYQMVCK